MTLYCGIELHSTYQLIVVIARRSGQPRNGVASQAQILNWIHMDELPLPSFFWGFNDARGPIRALFRTAASALVSMGDWSAFFYADPNY